MIGLKLRSSKETCPGHEECALIYSSAGVRYRCGGARQPGVSKKIFPVRRLLCYYYQQVPLVSPSDTASSSHHYSLNATEAVHNLNIGECEEFQTQCALAVWHGAKYVVTFRVSILRVDIPVVVFSATIFFSAQLFDFNNLKKNGKRIVIDRA